MTISTRNKTRKWDRIPPGYLPKRLEEVLERCNAATIPTLVAEIPARMRHPQIKSSVVYALRGHQFINPYYGVYGLGRCPPTWAEITRAWSPFNATVLDALSHIQGSYTSTLVKRIHEINGFGHITDADVRKALVWLRKADLVFNKGHMWAKRRLAYEQCQAPSSTPSLAFLLS